MLGATKSETTISSFDLSVGVGLATAFNVKVTAAVSAHAEMASEQQPFEPEP